jgi:nucleoid-associated protein YgaU
MKNQRILKTLLFVTLALQVACAGEIYNTKGKGNIFLEEKLWTAVCRHNVARNFLVIKDDPNCIKAEIVVGPSRGKKGVWHAQARGVFKEKKGLEVTRWIGHENSLIKTKLQDNFNPDPSLIFESLADFEIFLKHPEVWYTIAKMEKQKKDSGSSLLASTEKSLPAGFKKAKTETNFIKLPIKTNEIEIETEKNEFLNFEIASLAIPRFKFKEKKITQKIKPVEIAENIKVKPIRDIKSVDIKKPETKTKKLVTKTYKVKRGDSLWKICQNNIKTKSSSVSNLISKIVEMNDISNPNLIFPGQVLTIPILA